MARTSSLLAVLAIVGCSGGDKDDPGRDLPGTDLEIYLENSYTFEGALNIGSIGVQPETDVAADWCGLGTDLRGREVTDQVGVDQILLVEFALSQQEIMEKVSVNELLQSDTESQWLLEDPGSCNIQLSDFEILSNAFDPDLMQDNGRNWLMSVMNTPGGRWDILMSTFVKPETGSENVVIVIDDDSADLDFDANLSDLVKLETVAVADNYTVDWSTLTSDIYGHDFDPIQGDRLLVGKVDADSVTDVEALFLRLDSEAEKLYYIDTYGITYVDDLYAATADDGTTFPGFDTSGIWLLGVECTTCTSPAPLWLSVVDVVEE
jgi:hypothetical protein